MYLAVGTCIYPQKEYCIEDWLAPEVEGYLQKVSYPWRSELLEDHTICDKCEEENHPEFQSDYIHNEVSDIVCANAAMNPRTMALHISRA